jgi:hypothetical protein
LNKRIGRKTAFDALFNAFKWLGDNAASSYRIERLGEYPLLSTRSPRSAFRTLRFLCHDPGETGNEAFGKELIACATSVGNRELLMQLAQKEQFTAFTYLDPSRHTGDSSDSTLPNQRQTIRDLFSQEHDSENLLLVRSDNLHANGYNSIRESITNLIAAEFFMSKGYMVLEDTGSGPDLIAFKSHLVDMLRERKFIGRGASVSELSTIRAFGRANQVCREDNLTDEVIAIESESVSPKKGTSQLRGGYVGKRFVYMGFFDKRVLAAPFLNQNTASIDVLTYDDGGIKYLKSDRSNPAPDFWRSKKLAFFEEIHNLIKATLLLNLTFEEIASMVSSGPLTNFQVLEEMPRIVVEKILDRIEVTI